MAAGILEGKEGGREGGNQPKQYPGEELVFRFAAAKLSGAPAPELQVPTNAKSHPSAFRMPRGSRGGRHGPRGAVLPPCSAAKGGPGCPLLRSGWESRSDAESALGGEPSTSTNRRITRLFPLVPSAVGGAEEDNIYYFVLTEHGRGASRIFKQKGLSIFEMGCWARKHRTVSSC